MNPVPRYPALPWSPFVILWRRRMLIYQLTRREVINRYKGSLFGLLWSFAQPVLLLLVYTFVFNMIFQAEWREGDSELDYALMLFSGLIVYNFFAEALSASAALIAQNPSYVKKVIFPLETLPWSTVGVAAFHAAVGSLALAIALLIYRGTLPWTFPLLPLAFAPLALLTLGLVWFFSGLAVYFRDVGHFLSVALVLMMFLSPVLYPVSAVPESLRDTLALNPLTPILQLARGFAVHGGGIDPLSALQVTLVGWLFAWAGLAWFQKVRQGFADVV